ncbi:PKD domain-containing protein [Miltoncostaea oceani]|uniref:PKD domain-containing protein n=1 Tax=Miltoncostaea oceani TaxID=2843216 RepID=UPI001C3CDD15|nr:PKD domain-containing protein [Miltoncostaea oceani]
MPLPHLRPHRSAFTLVELIVVIAVLIILMAIAIPTFLSIRETANSTQAQNSVTISYKNAKVIHAGSGAYPVLATLQGAIQSAEPELDVITTTPASRDPEQVMVNRDGVDQITVCAQASTGLIYCLRSNEAGAFDVSRSQSATIAGALCNLPTPTSAAGEGCGPGDDGVPSWSSAGGGAPAGPANQAPVSSFTYSPTGPTANATVTFTDASSDADGTIATREWDLDGNGSFEATGTAPTTSYPSPGPVTVSLRVTDDDGETATSSQTLTVAAQPGFASTDGSDSFLSAAHSSTHTAGTSTLVFDGWVRRTAGAPTPAPQGAVFSTTGGNAGWTIQIDNTYRLRAAVATAPGVYVSSPWAAGLSLNNWHHVAIQITQNGVAVLLDGSAISTIALASPPAFGTAPTLIGREGAAPTFEFGVQVDSARITRGQTAAAIQPGDIVPGGRSTRPATLTAHSDTRSLWSFDGASGADEGAAGVPFTLSPTGSSFSLH